VDSAAAGAELYGLNPAEFVAARDARAADARRGGDKELAAAIKAMRRPSVGAWLANLLVREREEEVDRLIELGAQLRVAQDSLAPDQLRTLSQQRHRVVTALVKEAAGLAKQVGQSVSEAAVRDLEATLEAALADPDSAAALRGGQLTAGLSYVGLGLSGLAESSGVSGPGPDEAAAAAVRQAQAAVAGAERRLGEEQDRLEQAERERDRLAERISALEAELDGLRRRAADADGKVADLRLAVEEAGRQVQVAEEGLSGATGADAPQP
jgi:hypothetical protein